MLTKFDSVSTSCKFKLHIEMIDACKNEHASYTLSAYVLFSDIQK